MQSISRTWKWGIPLLGLCGLAGWAIIHLRNGKPSAWKPYGGRGKVSQVLLQLTGEGPKGVQAIHVPDGFEVEATAGPDLVQYAMFATLDDRGRLFVCESAGRNGTDQDLTQNPQFRIRLLEDTNGDGVYDRSKVFADKLTMSMGALWYRGSLYVAAPPDVLKLDDTDGDGVADRRTVILTGWPLKSNATTLHGPYLGPDGWMHLTYSPSPYRVQTKEGTVIEGRGSNGSWAESSTIPSKWCSPQPAKRSGLSPIRVSHGTESGMASCTTWTAESIRSGHNKSTIFRSSAPAT